MKIFLDTVGCRLNQSEIERMALEFRQAGHAIVGSMAEADMVVVNTCAVTTQAASDSRQKLRQAARMLPDRQIVATGCWATIEPEAARAISTNSRVVVNEDKDRLVSSLLNTDLSDMDLSLIEREALPGARHRIRAFVKAQDGCDAHCTYCVTRVARGPSRGMPIERVLMDIRSALEGGAKEIVLSGVQLGTWGKHFSQPSNLKELVRRVLSETGVTRLRLSSIEPWDLDQDFFRLFDDPRLCRHLHISLQSGCASTLKRMGRLNTPDEYMERLKWARELDPDFAITTDVITGFPGETMDEFQQSLNFIRLAGFSGGHVFPYSERPGTPAVSLPGKVPPRVRKERAAAVRKVMTDSALDFSRRFIGKKGNVLWETSMPVENTFFLLGYNEAYIRVTSVVDENLINNKINVIDTVQFTGTDSHGLTGLIIT
ncbi:MAG: tRNA (N(6)-L-threonylcarbamoyladenosine(37)-C(2))-methylthiotransferase MtaB [Chloroflexi bacterium]|nr:tRNA (N(6)-L-threonylcarbamoyladenosine(37)-C(2))-methylthiotransferase MtaB [Chloroflexota bacterium]